MKHVAFLRGINVGGHRKLPMADLRDLFTSLGHTEVRTYIQSGNVVYEPGADRCIQQAITERFGLEVPVVVRTGPALQQALDGHPFHAGNDEKRLAFTFLHQPPQGSLPDVPGPDQYLLGADLVYLHLPNGSARTKLTNNFFERHLHTPATTRNWRTVARMASWTTP